MVLRHILCCYHAVWSYWRNTISNSSILACAGLFLTDHITQSELEFDANVAFLTGSMSKFKSGLDFDAKEGLLHLGWLGFVAFLMRWKCNLIAKENFLHSAMSSEEEIHTSIFSYLTKILDDAVKDTHLVQGTHISVQNLQKPRYVFRQCFRPCWHH